MSESPRAVSETAVSPALANGHIRVAAPAKINLYLHILGKRPDGYHLLESLVAFTAFGDEITVAPADGLNFEAAGPYAGALGDAADNLVLRAAQSLAAELGLATGAAITLEKNLPVAAGIGGGSSDAAATLAALTKLWSVDLDEETMNRIGLSLGADVPVCRYGRTAHMTGIGETVLPGPSLPPCGILLVNPNLPLSTARVFGARSGPFSVPDPVERTPATVADLADALTGRRNDLAPAAIGLQPAIADVLAALDAATGCRLSRLSGSGPTCFGIFDDADGAELAATEIAANHPDWWVCPTRLKG